MITKKSIYRKLSIISLAVLIFVSSLVTSVSTANAVGVDTVVKLAGGKMVVRALAEKAGMALSKKQIDNYAGYIEKKTFDGDQRFIDFANQSNAVTSGAFQESSKSGFKKYLLDPAAWLLGLDVLFLVVDAFQDGYDTGTAVPFIGQCLPPPIEVPGFPYYIHYKYSTTQWVVYFDKPVTYEYTVRQSDGATQFSVKPADGTSTVNRVSKSSTTGTNWANGSSGSFGPTGYNAVTYHQLYNSVSNGICESSSVPTETDIVNVSNVDNSVINNFNNDTYNTNTTYNLEIELPDVPNYDDMTPWNEPDPQLGEAVDPILPPDSDGDGIPDSEDDSDGDGVTDDKDSEADKGGWLENLLPIITLIAIFDLLKAVIFYLARMFEFILTIPLIEAIPIDNVAFEWFRTAEIVGIEIYSVISLLATIGLSFAVYKVVRRLLP